MSITTSSTPSTATTACPSWCTSHLSGVDAGLPPVHIRTVRVGAVSVDILACDGEVPEVDWGVPDGSSSMPAGPAVLDLIEALRQAAVILDLLDDADGQGEAAGRCVADVLRRGGGER